MQAAERLLLLVLMQVEEDDDGLGLRSTEPGRIMAHNYIRMQTMAAITQVRQHCPISQ